MSSVPDHASATQWMVTCSFRPRRPIAAQDWVKSAADSIPCLSGSVRRTNSFSGGAGPGNGAPHAGCRVDAERALRLHGLLLLRGFLRLLRRRAFHDAAGTDEFPGFLHGFPHDTAGAEPHHTYASRVRGIPLSDPASSSAARFGIAYPHPGRVTVSSPPIDGRADGPCWVSHRCWTVIRPDRLNAAGTEVPHPG